MRFGNHMHATIKAQHCWLLKNACFRSELVLQPLRTKLTNSAAPYFPGLQGQAYSSAWFFRAKNVQNYILLPAMQQVVRRKRKMCKTICSPACHAACDDEEAKNVQNYVLLPAMQHMTRRKRKMCKNYVLLPAMQHMTRRKRKMFKTMFSCLPCST